jgi:hypothetical protein
MANQRLEAQQDKPFQDKVFSAPPVRRGNTAHKPFEHRGDLDADADLRKVEARSRRGKAEPLLRVVGQGKQIGERSIMVVRPPTGRLRNRGGRTGNRCSNGGGNPSGRRRERKRMIRAKRRLLYRLVRKSRLPDSLVRAAGLVRAALLRSVGFACARNDELIARTRGGAFGMKSADDDSERLAAAKQTGQVE